MKDKKCSTKECKNLINSKMSKSGLCSKCYLKKFRKKFYKENKVALNERRREYYKENKEREGKVNKKYRDNNPEKISEIHSKLYKENTKYYKDLSKKHYEDNKEKRAKQNLDYANKRYKEDEGFRIRKQLGSALSMVIRVYIKTGKIRNPMKKYGINWGGIIWVLSPIPKNRSDYQVDHIIPLYKFDLTNIEQIQIAFAPENHRWLLTKENQRRSRKA